MEVSRSDQRVRPARPPPPNIGSEQCYENIKDYYHTSMCLVNNGLSADEEGSVGVAIQQYMNALQCLEKGVAMKLNGLTSERRSSAEQMISKMIPAMEHVQSRLYELQDADDGSNVPEYSAELPEGHMVDMATSPVSNMQISDGGDVSSENSLLGGIFSENAVELLRIPGGVQLFSVGDDLDVNAAPPSYPSSLSVILLDEQSSSQQSRPPAFIKVGDWVYPLLPGYSPVLRCSNGAYMFPNLTLDGDASQPSSVGLVISSSVDSCYVEMFDNILTNMACLQVQEHRLEGEPDINLSNSVDYQPASDEPSSGEVDNVSGRIADGIEKGAGWISWGLSKGAEFTTSLIKQGAAHLQINVKPNEKATSVNPNVKKGLYYTHEASKITVKVSAALVRGLTTLTREIGKSVAPHVKSCASSLLPSSVTQKDEKGSSNVDGFMTVAGAGLAGFGTVWSSLEEAGMAIAKSVSSATVDTVEHKYGSEAGTTTSHAMGAAVNAGRTVFNVDNLGIKAIAKRAAKDTGKAVLKDYCNVGKSSPVDADKPSSVREENP